MKIHHDLFKLSLSDLNLLKQMAEKKKEDCNAFAIANVVSEKLKIAMQKDFDDSCKAIKAIDAITEARYNNYFISED